MAITRTAMVDDDGSGTTGTIINNAWKTEFYNQIDAAIAPLGSGGTWQAVPFNAAHYTATGGGTWTVGAAGLAESRYTLLGKTLHWSLFIAWYASASTVAGAVTTLNVTLPGGLSAGGNGAIRLARFIDGNSQWIDVLASTAGGATTIGIARVTGAAFTAGQIGFQGMMTFEVL
jgi:hypothetical protein